MPQKVKKIAFSNLSINYVQMFYLYRTEISAALETGPASLLRVRELVVARVHAPVPRVRAVGWVGVGLPRELHLLQGEVGQAVGVHDEPFRRGVGRLDGRDFQSAIGRKSLTRQKSSFCLLNHPPS